MPPPASSLISHSNTGLSSPPERVPIRSTSVSQRKSATPLRLELCSAWQPGAAGARYRKLDARTEWFLGNRRPGWNIILRARRGEKLLVERTGRGSSVFARGCRVRGHRGSPPAAARRRTVCLSTRSVPEPQGAARLATPARRRALSAGRPQDDPLTESGSKPIALGPEIARAARYGLGGPGAVLYMGAYSSALVSPAIEAEEDRPPRRGDGPRGLFPGPGRDRRAEETLEGGPS